MEDGIQFKLETRLSLSTEQINFIIESLYSSKKIILSELNLKTQKTPKEIFINVEASEKDQYLLHMDHRIWLGDSMLHEFHLNKKTRKLEHFQSSGNSGNKKLSESEKSFITKCLIDSKIIVSVEDFMANKNQRISVMSDIFGEENDVDHYEVIMTLDQGDGHGTDYMYEIDKKTGKVSKGEIDHMHFDGDDFEEY